MKVKYVAPDTMVIKAWPWPWIAGIGSLYTALLAIAVNAIFTNQYKLVIACAVAVTVLAAFTDYSAVDYLVLKLSKPDNLVSWRHLGLRGWSRHSLALDGLIEANVFDNVSPRALWWAAAWWGRMPPTLVLISHKHGEPIIHHVKGWVNGHEAINVANAINTWLSPPPVDSSRPSA